MEVAERGVAGEIGEGSQVDMPSCDASDGTDKLRLPG